MLSTVWEAVQLRIRRSGSGRENYLRFEAAAHITVAFTEVVAKSVL